MEEVFRIIQFDKNKYYEYAMKTKTEGKWPNEKHYTNNKLIFLGKYKESIIFGNFGDGRSGCEIFIDDDGKEKRINYDYEGNICFREMKR